MTVRPYSAEWRLGEEVALETSFGAVTIQPLGWGIRAETSRHQAPLRINGGPVRLSWADFRPGPGGYVLNDMAAYRGTSYDRATSKQATKLMNELIPLVQAWAEDNAEEVEKRRQAYIYDRARTCEESIEELENALADYRTRLKMIENGDMEISPYLNGGKGIST